MMIKIVMMMIILVLNQRKLSLKDKEIPMDLERWMIWEVQRNTMMMSKIVKRVMTLLNFQVKLK